MSRRSSAGVSLLPGSEVAFMFCWWSIEVIWRWWLPDVAFTRAGSAPNPWLDLLWYICWWERMANKMDDRRFRTVLAGKNAMGRILGLGFLDDVTPFLQPGCTPEDQLAQFPSRHDDHLACSVLCSAVRPNGDDLRIGLLIVDVVEAPGRPSSQRFRHFDDDVRHLSVLCGLNSLDYPSGHWNRKSTSSEQSWMEWTTKRFYEIILIQWSVFININFL